MPTYAEVAAEAPTSSVDLAAGVSANSEDAYKEEYDRQLAAWRAEADLARAKAERTRAEWEVRRKAEEEEAQKVAAATKEAEARQQLGESTMSGWETVSPSDGSKPLAGTSTSGGVHASNEQTTARHVSAARSAAHEHELQFGRDKSTPEPSPADSRDLVSGERTHTGAASGLNMRSHPPLRQVHCSALTYQFLVVPPVLPRDLARRNNTPGIRLRDEHIRRR